MISEYAVLSYYTRIIKKKKKEKWKNKRFRRRTSTRVRGLSSSENSGKLSITLKMVGHNVYRNTADGKLTQRPNSFRFVIRRILIKHSWMFARGWCEWRPAKRLSGTKFDGYVIESFRTDCRKARRQVVTRNLNRFMLFLLNYKH